MADSTIISWNVANWITVVLMVGLGFFIVGAAVKVIQEKRGAVA